MSFGRFSTLLYVGQKDFSLTFYVEIKYVVTVCSSFTATSFSKVRSLFYGFMGVLWHLASRWTAGKYTRSYRQCFHSANTDKMYNWQRLTWLTDFVFMVRSRSLMMSQSIALCNSGINVGNIVYFLVHFSITIVLSYPPLKLWTWNSLFLYIILRFVFNFFLPTITPTLFSGIKIWGSIFLLQ